MATILHKLRSARLRWPLFVLLLAGVGLSLHLTLPPAPRWIITASSRYDGVITAGGKTLVTYSDIRINLWDTSNGASRGSFSGPNLYRFRDLATIHSRYFPIMLDEYRAQIIDLETGQAHIVTLPAKWIPDLVVVAESPSLAVLGAPDPNSGDGNLHVVEVSSGKLLVTLPCYFYESPLLVDDDLLFYASPGHTALKVWSIKDCCNVSTFVPKDDSVLFFSPLAGKKVFIEERQLPPFTSQWPKTVGDRVVAPRTVRIDAVRRSKSRTAAGEVRLFGLMAMPQMQGPLPAAATGFLTDAAYAKMDRYTKTWQLWDLQSGDIRPIGIAESNARLWPDGRTIAFWPEVSPDRDCTLELYDCDGTQKRVTLFSKGLYRIEFSPDSRFLVEQFVDANFDAHFAVVDIGTDAVLWKGSHSQFRNFDFSPDSNFLIGTPRAREFTVFKSSTGKVQWSVSAKPGKFWGDYMIWYPDGKAAEESPGFLERWLGDWYPFK